MPVPAVFIWALVAIAAAALCISAWRSWRFDKIARMMLTGWQTMVSTDAKKAELEQEREQQRLYLESQTSNERVDLERVKLARARAAEYNALQQELTGKGRELLEEAREIGQQLTDRIPTPTRHPATVQAESRTRPAAAGNGGKHRKDPDPVEVSPN